MSAAMTDNKKSSNYEKHGRFMREDPIKKKLNFASWIRGILDENNQSTPPINIFNIAYKEGLELKYLPKRKVTEQGIEGQLTYHHRQKQWVIHYNGYSSTTRQRFTVAHELGHYFVHQHTFVDTGDIMYRDVQWDISELQANQFAGELLMPVDMVLSEGKKIIDYVESQAQFIERMASTFMVSKLAMHYRLINLQLLSG